MSQVLDTVNPVRADSRTHSYVDRAGSSITNPFARDIALGVMRRTRMLLAGGHYRDGSVVHVFRVFIDQKYRDRVAMIDYLEGELIGVELPSGYTGYFVLRWSSGREEFVLQAAPSE